jgi:hypothetical protein
MAKKKSIGAKNATPFEQVDPIIVGGGGSALILIRKDTNPQLVDSGNANYFAIKCNVDITQIVANDGFGGHVSPPGDGTGQVHPTRHKTFFKQ